MSKENKQYSDKEIERWKLKLQREKALKKKRNVRRIGILKILVWIGFLGIPLLYQFAYINSLNGFTFSVDPNDLSSVKLTSITISDETGSQEFDINNLMDEVIEYNNLIFEPVFGQNSSLNVTLAAENVLSNNSLIQPLSLHVGYQILTLENLTTALQNKTVPRYLIDAIYEAIFRWEIPKIFPDSWNDLVYFYIGYNGIFPITDIQIVIDIIYKSPIRLIESVSDTLSKEKTVALSLKIATVLEGILHIIYPILVNATYKSMIAGGFSFYEYFGEYFKTEFYSIDLWLSLGVYAKLGFIPVRFKVDVDLVWVIKQLIEEYE